MQKGTVKFYDPTKGYGFITPSDGSRDVFFHARQVVRPEGNPDDAMIFGGMPATFDIGRGRDGRVRAENVQLEQ